MHFFEEVEKPLQATRQARDSLERIRSGALGAISHSGSLRQAKCSKLKHLVAQWIAARRA
jgi:hypothetical protein